MEVTLAKCEMCGQYYQASEHHKCLLKPTQSNVINAINKATEDAKKPQLIKPLWVETLEKEIREDERAKVFEEVIKTLAKSEDTILSDKQYYTLMELKEKKNEIT